MLNLFIFLTVSSLYEPAFSLKESIDCPHIGQDSKCYLGLNDEVVSYFNTFDSKVNWKIHNDGDGGK